VPLGHSPLVWIGFNLFILAMVGLDLLVFGRRPMAPRMSVALLWSGLWIGLSLAFAGLLWRTLGSRPALEFLTGWLIEKSLSVDNLFVFILIFSYFRTPAEYQHKVLSLGILGALALRLGFILAGVRLLATFHWLIYGFGAVLVFSGVRMWSHSSEEIHPEKNPILNLVRRLVPVTAEYAGPRFFVVREARRFATPLLAVLVMVETMDLVFAVDSIPAVLAITRDAFIVYSSNAFAILGLRALYFVLAGAMRLFHRLHFGLAAILVFVGLKMLLNDLVPIPVAPALLVVGAILAISVGLSLLFPQRVAPAPRAADAPEPQSARPK
jgi:tellurite resistance protein TerC